jgi:hypothetical protein
MNHPEPTNQRTRLRLLAALVALSVGAVAAIIAILLLHTALA